MVMHDSLHGDLREPAFGFHSGLGESLRREFSLTPEERAARDEQRRAEEAADDLARGPVVELPEQDPEQPTLYLVITEEPYDTSTVHGVFPTREQAEAHIQAEIRRYNSLPKAQQAWGRGIFSAEVQAWKGRIEQPSEE
ncbi:hypothetical protein C5B94_03915 [Clavibacter michiganensis]|nr:hypothetical protein C5B94_03915 [Clavibacter michiganensis]